MGRHREEDKCQTPRYASTKNSKRWYQLPIINCPSSTKPNQTATHSRLQKALIAVSSKPHLRRTNIKDGNNIAQESISQDIRTS